MLNTLRFILNHPLNRDRKWAALARYVRWQVGSRLLRYPVAVPFTEHARLLVATSMRGATGNIYCGLHEFEDMAFVLHFLRRGDQFIDVGANVGTYTILAAKVCGAKVLAVEPVPATFDRLLDNIAINNVQQTVTAVRTGLGREAGVLRFTRGLDTMNHVIPAGAMPDEDSIECPVVRLDELADGWRPAFVKMDVEGYETEVVAGGSKTFSAESLRGVLVENNAAGGRYDKSESDLHNQMLGFGFRAFRYHPFERKLEALAVPRSANTLYLRDESSALEIVRTAESISVLGKKL